MSPIAIAVLVAAVGVLAAADAPKPAAAGSPLDLSVTGLDGSDYALAQHRGQVVLIVNVASKCGCTPQYRDLQQLQERYQGKGFTVIGVPSNDFGAQEPGSAEEIQQFCSTTYHVTFPLLAKVPVKGDGICPLYRTLTTTGAKPGPIAWNFTKFLIGRDGAVIDRFEPKTTPSDPAVIAAIDAALAQPVPKPAR
jgi:glutathione peroxidase